MTRNPNRKGKNPEKARPMLPKDRSLDVGPEVKRQTSTPLTLNPVHIAYDSSGPSSTHQSSLETPPAVIQPHSGTNRLHIRGVVEGVNRSTSAITVARGASFDSPSKQLKNPVALTVPPGHGLVATKAFMWDNESSTSLLHDESTMTPRARSPEYLSPQSAILQAINEKRGEEETTKPTFRYTQPFDNLPSKPSDSPPKSTPGPNRHYKAFHNLPTPPWTDSQCSSTCSPAFPTTSCRTPFESIESRFSSTDFNPTDSDSKWLEPYTDTPSCPPLDTPKRRVACSSWTSTLTSEDDDSHLTAIKDVIARNMTPDWERFEEISCKFPPRMTPARAATPPAGFGRWAGYGRRLSTAVEEEEGEAGLEEKRRSLQLEREGAWWRNESTVERRNSVQERYPELSSGEWKGKRRGYPSDRGGLLYV
ncbi:hypothetical protein QBC39DRAFT_416211 [Podospora conica]|nr:hypothetical protein QBC39DRAFT_416211 [Schizothecium conicum]